ncbi:probable serine/threonine-protein kinase PBL26 [Physcomitrium patens]|uniref:Protein kinase domain-containing protein n=1 Tax=Physcomitrium patens TaxID=3218 RepID=A0A7I4ASM8_PHYPA|nr:probable serine/threonine-protein kinase PBL26 [Physcomitrium patens]|eukprot:XP_024393199.1 probable serine/threonine-protein kinase PBL26 [Physcomitrella patens]
MTKENRYGNIVLLFSAIFSERFINVSGSRWNFWLQMLIYKFLPRGNLRDHLKPIVNFDYGSRIRIALGTAKAILYLHTEENLFIFLCSIKTNNIPLDQNSNAKAFDFGLSHQNLQST